MQINMTDEARSFLQKVYGWMFLGLVVSGLTAYFSAASGVFQTLLTSYPWVIFGLIIFELLLVVGLAFLLKKMSPAMATIAFIMFAFVNGLTLSVIFLAYTTGSIFLSFFVAAMMFGLMSLFGAFTKMDLSKIGTIMLMGLIGVIIASIVNIFLHSSTFDFILSIITVIVFTGLTAYDTQRILARAFVSGETASENSKASISGALSLYLDFINLFLSLLRIFGKARN